MTSPPTSPRRAGLPRARGLTDHCVSRYAYSKELRGDAEGDVVVGRRLRHRADLRAPRRARVRPRWPRGDKFLYLVLFKPTPPVCGGPRGDLPKSMDPEYETADAVGSRSSQLRDTMRDRCPSPLFSLLYLNVAARTLRKRRRL